jgi:hypothetical protein
MYCKIGNEKFGSSDCQWMEGVTSQKNCLKLYVKVVVIFSHHYFLLQNFTGTYILFM